MAEPERGRLLRLVPGDARREPERPDALAALARLAVAGGSCGLRGGNLWCWGEDYIGLVRRTWPFEGLAVVLDAPKPLQDFCLIESDRDFDGYADCRGDCDDGNPDISPFQPESCNGIDDNCDGNIDEACDGS